MNKNDENEENGQLIKYFHSVAVQFYKDESRVFWTKVAALLTINSLLLIGFTTLNISCNPSTTLLLVIAASGISIQAMWPIFAVQSSCIWERLTRYIRDRERRLVGDHDVLKVSEELRLAYEEFAGPLKCFKRLCKKPPEYCQRLYNILNKNLAGAIVIFLFFTIFMVIWIVAVLMVKTSFYCQLLAILLPILLVVIPSGVLSCQVMRRIFRRESQ